MDNINYEDFLQMITPVKINSNGKTCATLDQFSLQTPDTLNNLFNCLETHRPTSMGLKSLFQTLKTTQHINKQDKTIEGQLQEPMNLLSQFSQNSQQEYIFTENKKQKNNKKEPLQDLTNKDNKSNIRRNIRKEQRMNNESSSKVQFFKKLKQKNFDSDNDEQQVFHIKQKLQEPEQTPDDSQDIPLEHSFREALKHQQLQAHNFIKEEPEPDVSVHQQTPDEYMFSNRINQRKSYPYIPKNLHHNFDSAYDLLTPQPNYLSQPSQGNTYGSGLEYPSQFFQSNFFSKEQQQQMLQAQQQMISSQQKHHNIFAQQQSFKEQLQQKLSNLSKANQIINERIEIEDQQIHTLKKVTKVFLYGKHKDYHQGGKTIKKRCRSSLLVDPLSEIQINEEDEKVFGVLYQLVDIDEQGKRAIDSQSKVLATLVLMGEQGDYFRALEKFISQFNS